MLSRMAWTLCVRCVTKSSLFTSPWVLNFFYDDSKTINCPHSRLVGSSLMLFLWVEEVSLSSSPSGYCFLFLGLMGNGRWLQNFIPVQLPKRVLKEWAMEEGQFWHVKHYSASLRQCAPGRISLLWPIPGCKKCS
jgi:hypothetical protein